MSPDEGGSVRSPLRWGRLLTEPGVRWPDGKVKERTKEELEKKGRQLRKREEEGTSPAPGRTKENRGLNLFKWPAKE